MSTNTIVDLNVHHAPRGASDRVAFGFVKALRFFADTFFSQRYGHRAVVLETVAAVPGMVGATLLHLKSLRRMSDDHGWIRTLLDEAENERMHLMTFIKIARPTLLERAIILLVQGVFYNAFFLLYLASPKTAHRVVGYFEEEAVISYTHYLAEIDAARQPNLPAPELAKRYWSLAPDATLRDVVLAVRADEAGHRDVNHGFADELAGGPTAKPSRDGEPASGAPGLRQAAPRASQTVRPPPSSSPRVHERQRRSHGGRAAQGIRQSSGWRGKEDRRGTIRSLRHRQGRC